MELSELRKPRTSIDWSKHELIVIKNKDVLIHKLKIPDTSMDCVIFINAQDVCSVTGDYGNWIFCREFHPSKEGYVSSGYWGEKLKIASSQNGVEFDSKATREEIEEGLKTGLKEYGYEDEYLKQMEEYFGCLLNYVDCSEWEYTAYAYNNFPSFNDGECVPFCQKDKYWLKAVFDAFNEICRRMELEK